jgi:TetR/AcrR family transcriptional regulator, cholesterol catabolism regulator
MARERATDTSALVRAAARVFEEKGYRNATIDDIAAAAGISRPTVYKYSRSKQWLLDRIADEVTSYLGARLRAILDSSAEPAARLRQVIEIHVEAAVTNRTFYAIVFSEETELSGLARRKFRIWAHQVTEDFRELMEECRAAGGPSDGLNTTIAAHLILTMLTSLHRWYQPGGAVKPGQLTEQILAVVGAVFPGVPVPR